MPILFERQRKLLLLLGAIGGWAGNLDFQKLLFLFCQEDNSGKPYEFVPYQFGAFSFTSYADRRKLMERGLLAHDEHAWRLTDGAWAVIGRTQDLQFTAFAQRFQACRGDALIAETYRRFPYYATRSTIIDRVLPHDAVARDRVSAARPARKPAGVSTIGYEGRSLESYLNELLGSGVTLLCDVRRNPISRKYGFSKGTLSKGCEGVGIRYEHLPGLGIASEQRQGLGTRETYDALFADYERAQLPKATDDLAKITGWVLAGEAVALTCYELAPQLCHRRCVAEALESRLGNGLAATHL